MTMMKPNRILLVAGLLIATCAQLSSNGQGLGVVGDVLAYSDGSTVIQVRSVIAGGVAQSVGVQPGDVIRSINGIAPGDATTNQRALSAARGQVTLSVLRGGRPLTLNNRVQSARPSGIPGSGLPIPGLPRSSGFPATGGLPATGGFPATGGRPSSSGIPGSGGLGSPSFGGAGTRATPLDARQADAAARFVTTHWNNDAMAQQSEAQLRQLFEPRSQSANAIRGVLVPFLEHYLRSNYYANNPIVIARLERAIDILRRCGPDAAAAEATLQGIVQQGGALAQRAQGALSALHSVTIDAELSRIVRDPRTQVPSLVLKTGTSEIVVEVPRTVRVDNRTLQSRFITVTYDGRTNVAIDIRPTSLGGLRP